MSYKDTLGRRVEDGLRWGEGVGQGARWAVIMATNTKGLNLGSEVRGGKRSELQVLFSSIISRDLWQSGDAKEEDVENDCKRYLATIIVFHTKEESICSPEVLGKLAVWETYCS